MVVIGGLGSIPGAILGALYLEGLPAIFGANQTIQFITSGLGLIAFILYLPGGLAELLHRSGDLVTGGHPRRAGAVLGTSRATPGRRSRPALRRPTGPSSDGVAERPVSAHPAAPAGGRARRALRRRARPRTA